MLDRVVSNRYFLKKIHVKAKNSFLIDNLLLNAQYP